MEKRPPTAESVCLTKVRLDPVLDIKAVVPLYTTLNGHRGHDLVLDASAVERMGGQCLQVLLAARACWAADRHGFVIHGFSPGVVATMELMGIVQTAFDHQKEIGT